MTLREAKADYRDLLYASYLTTHCSDEATPTVDVLRRQTPVFDGLLGPSLPSDRNARILDLGCGYGRFVWYLHERGFNNAIGIDISQEQVAAAAALGLGDAISRGDARQYLSEHRGAFDMVVALDLL